MMFHVLFASADFRTSIDSVLTLAGMAAIISDLPSSQNSFFENPKSPKNPKNHEHHNIPKKIREIWENYKIPKKSQKSEKT